MLQTESWNSGSLIIPVLPSWNLAALTHHFAQSFPLLWAWLCIFLGSALDCVRLDIVTYPDLYTLIYLFRVNKWGLHVASLPGASSADFSSSAFTKWGQNLFPMSLNCWVKHKHSQENSWCLVFLWWEKEKENEFGEWEKSGRKGGEETLLTPFAAAFFYSFGICDVIMTGLAVKKCPGEREWKNWHVS